MYHVHPSLANMTIFVREISPKTLEKRNLKKIQGKGVVYKAGNAFINHFCKEEADSFARALYFALFRCLLARKSWKRKHWPCVEYSKRRRFHSRNKWLHRQSQSGIWPQSKATFCAALSCLFGTLSLSKRLLFCLLIDFELERRLALWLSASNRLFIGCVK